MTSPVAEMRLCRRVRTLAVCSWFLLLTGLAGAQNNPAPPEAAGGNSVAVVPLNNITGDPDDSWIGAGIAETLVADLEAEPRFTVFGREFVAEAMAERPDTVVAGDDAALLELGRRVGARWVIGGGYQHVGSQIRITARLIEVSTGTVARSAKVQITDLARTRASLASGHFCA